MAVHSWPNANPLEMEWKYGEKHKGHEIKNHKQFQILHIIAFGCKPKACLLSIGSAFGHASSHTCAQRY
jgi:hypothetical protein